MFNVTQSHS